MPLQRHRDQPKESDRRVAIVADSAASMPPGTALSDGLHLVPLQVTLDGETYLDGVDLAPSDLYRRLRLRPEPPLTSAPSPAGFLEAFRLAGASARPVLCLTVAARFSASFDSATTAAREARERDGIEVSVLDTQTAAGGEGLVVLEAWRAARSGATVQQTMEAARRVVSSVRLLAFPDTLYYLWRGGRVRRIAYHGTSLLRIKPLFELDRGEVRPVARPRTQRRAVLRLVELMRQRVGDRAVHAAVMHADAADAGRDLEHRVRAAFACEEVYTTEFSAAMGAHIGPGLLGVAFWSKESPDISHSSRVGAS